MMMTITAAPEAPNTTTTTTATTGAITTSNDWDSIKITKSNTKIKPLKVLIAFTAISLKLVYCCCRTPTTATKTPAAAREEKMESIRIICWVCVRAVQTEKPFICSTHLSLCIVFFYLTVSVVHSLEFYFFLHIHTYLSVPQSKEEAKKNHSQKISIQNDFSYPFQRFAALRMAASVATVHLSAENYSLVHLHGQAPEKRIAMKTFCPTSRLYSVKHPADEFRYFASLNALKRPWK